MKDQTNLGLFVCNSILSLCNYFEAFQKLMLTHEHDSLFGANFRHLLFIFCTIMANFIIEQSQTQKIRHS